VGKVRGPGAMMSAEGGAAKYVGHWEPDCCCCAYAVRLSNRVMPAYNAFAPPEARGRLQARCQVPLMRARAAQLPVR
jgi:hypothetical protein